MTTPWKSLATAALLSLALNSVAAAKDVEPAALPSPAAEAVESDEALAELVGGTNTVVALTDQDLTAINTGNQITADTVGSGAINLSGSALSDFNGIGNFIMNTGHNNNLQSSVSVTVIVTQ